MYNRALQAERLEDRLRQVLDDHSWTNGQHSVERRFRRTLAEAQQDQGALVRLIERRPALLVPCGPLDPEFGILACDPDLGSAIPILDL